MTPLITTKVLGVATSSSTSNGRTLDEGLVLLEYSYLMSSNNVISTLEDTSLPSYPKAALYPSLQARIARFASC